MNPFTSHKQFTLAALAALAFCLPVCLGAESYTVLHAFHGVDGANPTSGLVRDAAGNFYGTAAQGGTTGAGTIYKLDSAGNFTVLYQFTGGASGYEPYAEPILDSAGNLYGTTVTGGRYGAGAVYKLDSAGNLAVLHSFEIQPDGARPSAGVVQDASGNLYGAASLGGDRWGVLFKIDTAGNYSVLYTFTGGKDGGYPLDTMTIDGAGDLYGTTLHGGVYAGGVVFKLTAAGKYRVLHSFNAAGGDGPSGGVVRDGAGNLYGVTYDGGSCASDTYGCGVVYKLDAQGNYTVLYTFTGTTDGSNPNGGLVRDETGNLYGTTVYGGSANCQKGSCGVAFELDSAGTFSLVHSFEKASGINPYGKLLVVGKTLYGTTDVGGGSGDGVLFRLK